MPRTKKPAIKEIKRYTLQNVVSVETTLQFRLRLKLSCGHTKEVGSFRAGKQAKCYDCGKSKPLEYDEFEVG
jgi:hypothetical protein